MNPCPHSSSFPLAVTAPPLPHNHARYDAENRLVQVDGTLGTCASGSTTGTTACYYYDAEGHRVWRTGFTNDTCDNTGKRGYTFDLQNRWVWEVNGNGGPCNGEIYAGARHVASVYDGDVDLDHTDWLGTSRLRTDYQYTSSHGFQIGESCTSLPFGDATSCRGGANSSPLVFTGKELDNETGLDNFGARFDSSSFGRFISPDWSDFPEAVPYGDEETPQSLNLYSYVGNNALNSVDLDGHDQCQGNPNCVEVTATANDEVTYSFRRIMLRKLSQIAQRANEHMKTAWDLYRIACVATWTAGGALAGNFAGGGIGGIVGGGAGLAGVAGGPTVLFTSPGGAANWYRRRICSRYCGRRLFRLPVRNGFMRRRRWERRKRRR